VPDAAPLVAAVEQAVRHLGLGRWRRVVVEAGGWHLAVAPAPHGLATVAAPPEVPLGLALRQLELRARGGAPEVTA
ncbi:MAG TPA: hypothetical protein VFS08_17540, partial [Gemmatimonadaceae bacterium]|nr:hypothetical protein [Gemmatimonadaceae bacterium]